MSSKSNPKNNLAVVPEHIQKLRDLPAPTEGSFGAYLDAVDEMLSLPFLPRTDAARQGIPFTILRIAERQTTDPATQEPRAEWAILAELEVGCTIAQRNTGAATTFEPGERVVIGYGKSGVRDQVIETARQHVEERGPIEHMALREIRSKDPLHSNPIVLCNARSWVPLA